VDAKDKVLGRLASRIAHILLGKHKVYYTPGVDCGDFVVVINAKHICLTGKKLKQKFYYRHSGYMGGLKTISYAELLKKAPEKIIYLAVKRMLPRNQIAKRVLRRLKIYKDKEHKHTAQKLLLLKEKLLFLKEK
jgi:large subunit ribosomal protein L13